MISPSSWGHTLDSCYRGGLSVNRMSRVPSYRVGISITWGRQCSWTISTKWDCTCLLGISRDTYSLFQSISPQLKSPSMRTWEFLHAMIHFREPLSWSKIFWISNVWRPVKGTKIQSFTAYNLKFNTNQFTVRLKFWYLSTDQINF